MEATKFTEVGFHGRDVDQIIRDLVDNAISLQRQKVCVTLVYKVNRDVSYSVLKATHLFDICVAHYLVGLLQNVKGFSF